MNTKMKWRMALSPLLLAVVASPVAGCDEAGLDNPLDSLCCSDFKVGADLTGVDWGLEGEANVKFGAGIQAIADFSGSASAVVTDVGSACQALAIDLGAEEGAVTATEPAARTKAWCDQAVAQINAKITGQGSVTISFQPPVCSFSVSAQASCEAKCTADVMCQAELGNIEARCEPGMLSGKCSAECSGRCEGSANLAVTCQGTCEGTCEGMCGGMPSGGSCAGVCDGTCRGTCQPMAGASVTCEGDCTGGCSVAVTAPKCKAELTPPSANCQGSAECSGSCQASASAKAECKEPSIEITATGGIDAQAIAALKLHLPKIILVAEVRGQLLLDNAQVVAGFSGNLAAGASADATAALCLIPAGAAIVDAVANIDASVKGTLAVTGSLGM
jgi:hypothetical protein